VESGGNGHGGGLVALADGPKDSRALTPRETEVFAWVAAGLQNKEIAQELGISLATVRNHVHNILEKVEVHSKLEAVSLAFRRGWMTRSNVPPALRSSTSPAGPASDPTRDDDSLSRKILRDLHLESATSAPRLLSPASFRRSGLARGLEA
jgi:DNA-binding CsgD family transcriptional regulator